MIKVLIQQEDTTFVNIYAPNIGPPKYMMQILTNIKNEIDSNTIAGDFNTPHTSIDRSSRQKISTETMALNNTLGQMNFKLYTHTYTYYSFYI